MPTPFYHLSVAQELLAGPGLPPAVSDLLRQHSSAFLLGHTAPDVQVVSGQPREATHFFELPLRPEDPPAHARLLQVYPALARGRALPAPQAAFLAGYLCHLLADWEWVQQIFIPCFLPGPNGLRVRQAHFLHNALRCYLDEQILPGLNGAVRSRLGLADPAGWLPVVEDGPLRRWRDLLAAQLQPGAPVRTVEVFAARLGLPPQAFEALLGSEERLEAELFSRLPRRALERYRARLVQDSLDLVVRYLTS